ncbi:DUF501 domain-containing protein [Persephonella sp.]
MGRTERTDIQKMLKDAVVENKCFYTEKGIIVPQPTRFWIVGKELKKRISQLEEKGFISWWEKKVTEDDRLFDFFVKLHQLEIKIRKERLKDKNLPDYVVKKLTGTGIGGIENFDRKPFKVKCLHLWTGYHIGDSRFKNPIGQFVLDKVL